MRAPEGDEHLLGARVLERLAQESFPEHSGGSAWADRVRVVALAMVQAQDGFVFERPVRRVRGYHALVAESAAVFGEIEEAVWALVRRGQLDRDDVPAPPKHEALDQRCRRIGDLVDLVEEHDEEGRFVRRDLLVRAEKLARRLEGAAPYGGREVSAREIRNRAFTLLCAVLHEAPRAPTPLVFPLTWTPTQRVAA